MRNYKVVILEAQLLFSPPQDVVAFLERRALLPENKRRDEDLDEEFEAALLGRNVPQIDLALARYAQYSSTVRPLFYRTQPGNAIRLAILSNSVIPSGYFSQLPLSLMEGPERVVDWIVTAPNIELHALFLNPLIHQSFIQDLLKGKAPWDKIPDEKLCYIVSLLAENPRMWQPYDRKHLDGFAEYAHNVVFNEAWHLAERVPTTQGWAMALASLYHRLTPDAFNLDNPLEVAGRWVADPDNAELMKQQESYQKTGYLHHYQEVRKGLAHLALTYKNDLLPTLLAHEDVAFRSAAYAYGKVTATMLPDIYEKDGELAFNQLCRNPWLWQRQEERDALKAVAWQITHADPNSDLLPVNIYNSVSEDFAKKNPDWFKDDYDYATEISAGPVTKADMVALSQTLDDHRNSMATQMLANLKKLESQVGWIFWFSLGALAMGIKHL